MALLEYLSPEEAPAESREILEKFRDRTGGKVPLYYQLVAHNPHILKARWNYYFKDLMRGSRNVDGVLKEVIYVTVSSVNECEYCVAGHSQALLRHDVPEEWADHLIERDFEGLDDRERVVAEFAEKVATDPKSVSETDLERLYEQGFTKADVIQLLSIATAAINSNAFVDTMDIHPGDREGEPAP